MLNVEYGIPSAGNTNNYFEISRKVNGNIEINILLYTTKGNELIVAAENLFSIFLTP